MGNLMRTFAIRNALFAAFSLASLVSLAQTNVLLTPEADAFTLAVAPTNNYGRAGSLSVSGATATNGFGLIGGRADSLARFSLTETVASLDAAFGNHEWFIASAVLRLYEMGAPNNALFSRGVGAFEVRWLASGDVWQEGTGSPNVPTTDGVTFQDLPALLDSAHDLSLGVFTNNGADGPLTISLPLQPAFVEDLRAGGPMTLQFTPASDSIGFTFLSRNDPRTSLRIALELTVAAGPPPSISGIERFGNSEVLIRFTVRSNWTHFLQRQDTLGTNIGLSWTNIFTVSSAPSNTQAEVHDTVTNAQRSYRLLVVP